MLGVTELPTHPTKKTNLASFPPTLPIFALKDKEKDKDKDKDVGGNRTRKKKTALADFFVSRSISSPIGFVR